MKKIATTFTAIALLALATGCEATPTTEKETGKNIVNVSSFLVSGNDQTEEFVLENLSNVTYKAILTNNFLTVPISGTEEDGVVTLEVTMPEGLNLLAVTEDLKTTVPVTYVTEGDGWQAILELKMGEHISVWAYEPPGSKLEEREKFEVVEVPVYGILAED